MKFVYITSLSLNQEKLEKSYIKDDVIAGRLTCIKMYED